jgi:hydroxymethylglutaryl-CoA reductase (NADPH)
MEHTLYCPIPFRVVGPITIKSGRDIFQVDVPLATYESPLWPSVKRGALATSKAGGISVVITRDCMTRSILFDAHSAKRAYEIVSYLEKHTGKVSEIAESTSSHLSGVGFTTRIVGSCVFLRLHGVTGNASGHNMITKAADKILEWIATTFKDVSQISVSGNFCVDKKVSSVNAILGRGKSVIAEVIVSRAICKTILKSTPEAIVELNTKKNLVGSIINGGVQSANAHYANMLLAFYLATGQDAANIVEGSQGITFAELRGDDLYFSVSLPNIIVGTVGNGKNLPIPQKMLQELGCLNKKSPGENSKRLAEIAAATVLCGELNLLASQTQPGNLVRSHMKLERKTRNPS